MMQKTARAKSTYTLAAVRLHWLMAFLIIGLLAVGWLMAREYFEKPFLFTVYGWHKSLGIAVLALVAVRLAWRLDSGAPAPVASAPAWMRAGARLGHWALYALMIAMPLDGWLMSNAAGYPVSFFGLFTLPELVEKNAELGKWLRELHTWGMWAFFVLIGGHLAAALYHHLVLRDGTLRRMIPFLK